MTTELLGKAAIPNAAYEQPDGAPLAIATDYFGNRRDPAGPTPGPFEGFRRRAAEFEGVVTGSSGSDRGCMYFECLTTIRDVATLMFSHSTANEEPK